jgi:serine/threonine-protein kinase
VQGQLEHPSFVPVYDIDVRADGSVFFTMRRVLGRTLHAIVDSVRSGDLVAQARFT